MAKEILGEASLDTGRGKITLRLTIGNMIEIEDYFGVGTLNIISHVVPKMRAKDLAVLYLAMTGGSFSSTDDIKAVIPDLMEIGLADVGTAVAACLTNILVVGKSAGNSKKKPPAKT